MSGAGANPRAEGLTVAGSLLGVRMLLLLVAAWAQSTEVAPAAPAICPLLPSPRDAEVALIGDRARLVLDPEGAQRLSGLDLTGDDPAMLVPDHFWKELVQWAPGDDVVLIGASDPLELSAPDLAPRALRGLGARMGAQAEPWTTSALPVAPPLGPAVLAQPAPDPSAPAWGVVAEVHMPDGTVIELVGALFGTLAHDATCQAALINRLSTVRPGHVTKADFGNKHYQLPILSGGVMALDVPADMAVRVDVGMQRSRFVVQAWGRADSTTPPDQLAITVSHIPWNPPKADRKKPIATTLALGSTASWHKVKGAPEQRVAWVEIPGKDGGRELIQLELTSRDPASLLALVEVATLARRLAAPL